MSTFKHLLRVRFADDIVAEMLPSQKPSNKVIIFCDGMPGMPGNNTVQRYAAKKGFWTVFPRYRGSWESGGEFLAQSPYDDIKDVIEGLKIPMKSEWTGEEYCVENPQIYVIGASFGGPAAILSSGHSDVVKAIALSPVVDWKEEQKSEAEPMDWLGDVTKRAFGEGYRYTKENWERLASGEFYNPVDEKKNIDPKKLMIIHSEDDDVVLYPPVAAFARDIGCTFVSKKRGGHFGSSSVMRWSTKRAIKSFLHV